MRSREILAERQQDRELELKLQRPEHDPSTPTDRGDLNARGLLNTKGLAMTMTGNRLRSPPTAALGSKIVEFTLNRPDDEAR